MLVKDLSVPRGVAWVSQGRPYEPSMTVRDRVLLFLERCGSDGASFRTICLMSKPFRKLEVSDRDALINELLAEGWIEPHSTATGRGVVFKLKKFQN